MARSGDITEANQLHLMLVLRLCFPTRGIGKEEWGGKEIAGWIKNLPSKFARGPTRWPLWDGRNGQKKNIKWYSIYLFSILCIFSDNQLHMFCHISWSSPVEVRYAFRCFICVCQIQYSTWKHDITSRRHSVTQWNENIAKNTEKLTFAFFNRSFFTQKFVDSNAWIMHFSCFKEDKRIQDNCETVQHERTVFLSRQKLQKLRKRKNIDTNLTNQNRYINIPLAWIWFVYSFISFAFLLQAQGRIWCV